MIESSTTMRIPKRFTQALAAGGLLALFGGPLPGQAPVIQSARQPGVPVIDGRADDWTAAKFALDRKSGVEVAFRNDGKNLYVLFVAKRPDVIESLDSTGLAILVRPAGTKASRGVLFVNRRVSTDAYLRWRESQGALVTEDERARLRETDRHDLCLPFAVSATGSTYGPLRRLSETDPPEGAVATSADSTTYEFRVPLAAPTQVPGGIGVAPSGSAEVSFRWGGAEKKVTGVQSTRVTPPSEAGDLSGAGETWAQEYLHSFDSLSRPKMGTRKFAFAVDLKLSDAREPGLFTNRGGPQMRGPRGGIVGHEPNCL